MNQFDKNILKRAKHHDLAAFETILFSYEKRIFNYLRRLVSQRETAEDLTQETFIKLYKHIGSLNDVEKFRSWLYAIATNVAYDWLRQSKKLPELLLVDDPAANFETIDPDSQYYRIGTSQDLGRALEQVKPQYKAVLLLYYQQGFSYQEIAESMQIPINTVKTYLHRGKQEVRRYL